MFSNNTPCTPFLDESEEHYFVGQESWEAFVKSESENLCSQAAPAPGVSEMVFENPEKMVEEPQDNYYYNTYDQENHFRNFVDEPDLSKMRRPRSFRLKVESDNDLSETQGSSACVGGVPAPAQEEFASVSTRDSRYGECYTFDSDGLSLATDGEAFDEGVFDLETEITKKVIKAVRERPDEEKAYIEQIFPMLLNSVKEMFAQSQLPLSDHIIASIVNEMIHNKQALVAEEREVLNMFTEDEIQEVRFERPDDMITDDELAVSNRKEKRAVKGNRNGSSMNHFNENYVSNIFQFAKRNYPEDRELHRISNARNVSALNFRKLVNTKLTDGIMTRQAKARIAESGRELVENIEYWMREGYFEQCADREKYIYHKEKALRDLALAGRY